MSSYFGSNLSLGHDNLSILRFVISQSCMITITNTTNKSLHSANLTEIFVSERIISDNLSQWPTQMYYVKLTNSLFEANKTAYINVRIGSDFNFTFNIQERNPLTWKKQWNPPENSTQSHYLIHQLNATNLSDFSLIIQCHCSDQNQEDIMCWCGH